MSQNLTKTIKERKEVLEYKNFIKLLIESVTFEHIDLFSKNK